MKIMPDKLRTCPNGADLLWRLERLIRFRGNKISARPKTDETVFQLSLIAFFRPPLRFDRPIHLQIEIVAIRANFE
ncbi:hypothetical protein DC365_22355 [Vibrio vulnificus]|nr:hypothetical protein DC365_22355 [Vibrio vulnificus]TOD48375.1 hypothetical protein CGJ64_08070 [Vibrio parahaemolyticus]